MNQFTSTEPHIRSTPQKIMVELNLRFRSVAFLLLTSTSLVQSICYIGCDLEFGSFEQKVDHTLSFEYGKTGTPLITPEWIRRLNSSGFDALNSKPEQNGARKEIKVSPTGPPTPMVDRGFYDKLISTPASAPFNFSHQKHEYPMVRVLQSEQSNFSSSYSKSGGVPASELTVADKNGNNPPLNTCSGALGLSREAIVGITIVVVVVVVLFISGCLYIGVYRNKNAEISSALLINAHVQLMSTQVPSGSELSGGLASITLDKAVEFSYEELSKATNNFSLGNKIGQGGFSAVYYAELRGEKAAIKKMDMQASKEFLSELRVLTHVHHLNLVRLIGYCVQSSLFLVYEYIENGNLSQHLHGSGRYPLPWSIRVQIALDSARGLEYIHEYTASVFVHCDIKSTNILVDKNFNGKVADFGLAKLTGVGSISHLGGTFGYMPPEYVQYGEVSPKVDVFAFGVVLYELISAKKAIIRANDPDDEPKSLVALFEEVLSQAGPKDDLVKTIDPRLGDNYPFDSVHKMAQLAKVCTHEDPKQRPSMRSIVVALMTLSS